MTALTELNILSGWFPITLYVVGVLAFLALLAARDRRFVLRWIPIAVAGTAVAVGVAYVLIEHVFRPFPDPIPIPIYLLVAVGIVAIVLAVIRIARSGRRRRTALTASAAALVAVLAAATAINAWFAYYPTLGSVVGVRDYRELPASDIPGDDATQVTGAPLMDAWSPPDSMPADGAVTEETIPGTVSGFSTRPAQIYLPPAYFADSRPDLPVLILMAGQPGEPLDWLVGGKLAETMDAWASNHEGLAPVVVVADATGSAVANPLCVDSPKGNAATYLSVDVPQWIKNNLQVSTDPSHWAIGGLSYGGTCALQMAVTHPDLFPTFLDFSGQLEPTDGTRESTVNDYFGGDANAFAAINPMDIMASKKFPNTAGRFVVGENDSTFRDDLRKVYEAARAAGMTVTFDEVPGGHSYEVWSVALRDSMDWLGTRLAVTS